jgi:1,4-alpha-glucan branching enzyme
MSATGLDISYPKYLFHQGTNSHAYEWLGVHHTQRGRAKKTLFRVWAPRAAAVSLVGDFNGWDQEATPMSQRTDDPEIWECLCDHLPDGTLYKFAIKDRKGSTVFKADPFAFFSEAGAVETGHMRASVVTDIQLPYQWSDSRWMHRRARLDHRKEPMNIYEVHLGSWKRQEDGSYLTYRQLARDLIPYVKKMGYTHIELLPITEYPYDGSWGYQTTGYFSVTSRYGCPEDFKFFVDTAHAAEIGVIMDWVPAHFPKDQHGLIEFDGQPLYEYSDPFKMEHKGWGTRSFDFGRPEVVSFLISSATFFCDKYHIDGIRVDAVAAMLYLDYDRKEGEWRPNKNGGRENLEAIRFLQALNRSVLSEFPGVIMIAEESTAWPMVTMPPDEGGLGFNFKWNMGWMNDVLEYFQTDPLFRRGVHHKLTFSISYAYSENYILPISHDEVVHGKKSLLDKMPGEYEKKFAGLRAFFVYMMTHPGKKLLFMGSEFGQFIEWNEKQGLDWLLLDYEMHRKLRSFLQDLNIYYLKTPALWRLDTSYDGFTWINADDMDRNTYTYYRSDGQGGLAVCILNLSGQELRDYPVGVPAGTSYVKMIDSDMRRWGGSGHHRKKSFQVISGACSSFEQHIEITMAPLSAIVLERRS